MYFFNIDNSYAQNERNFNASQLDMIDSDKKIIDDVVLFAQLSYLPPCTFVNAYKANPTFTYINYDGVFYKPPKNHSLQNLLDDLDALKVPYVKWNMSNYEPSVCEGTNNSFE